MTASTLGELGDMGCEGVNHGEQLDEEGRVNREETSCSVPSDIVEN